MESLVLTWRQDDRKKDCYYLADGVGSTYGPFTIFVLFEVGVKVGSTVSPTDLAKLQERQWRETIREAALSILDRRMASTAQIKRLLLQKYPDHIETIGRVIDWLQNEQLLDDFAYGKRVAEQFIARGKGSHAELKRTLMRKGIDQKTMNRIVETITYDEYPSAYQSAKKQLIVIIKKVDKELIKKGLPSSSRQRLIRHRLAQYLSRQGYQQEMIHRVWDAILQEASFP